jgi:uncharacterized membrane protein
MTQSKKHSTIETVVNVGSGYFVAFGLNLTVLPFFVDGITEQSITTAVIIGVIYTGVSMIRSFMFRRLFNRWTDRND